jgi:hypothetical protein
MSYAIAYYYDVNGDGRWASGVSPLSSSSTIFDYVNMDHVNGYPRTSNRKKYGSSQLSFQ